MATVRSILFNNCKSTSIFTSSTRQIFEIYNNFASHQFSLHKQFVLGLNVGMVNLGYVKTGSAGHCFGATNGFLFFSPINPTNGPCSVSIGFNKAPRGFDVIFFSVLSTLSTKSALTNSAHSPQQRACFFFSVITSATKDALMP